MNSFPLKEVDAFLTITAFLYLHFAYLYVPFPLFPTKQEHNHHASPFSISPTKRTHQLSTEHTMSSESTPSHKFNKAKEPPQSPIHRVLSWTRYYGSACLRPATAGPLLVACVCLAMVYKSRKKYLRPKEAETAAHGRPVMHRSLSMATLHGGKVALQRIMDSQEARIDQASLENEARTFRGLLDQKPLNFSMLQRTAAKLEMSGKEDEAVEILQKAWKDADKDGKTHEAYELEMLLVEMLIYKGNYQDALKCKCLNDKEISDARGPLYQAVIHSIEGDRNRAKECYEQFQDIRRRFHWPDTITQGSPLYGLVHDFQVFEKIVSNLKREIEHAHKMKQLAEAKAK